MLKLWGFHLAKLNFLPLYKIGFKQGFNLDKYLPNMELEHKMRKMPIIFQT